MAALRHGIRTVILPKANERDLEEIDQTVRKSLNFITVDHVDSVLQAALYLPKREEAAVQEPQPEEAPLLLPHAPANGTGRKPALRQ